LAFGPPQGIPVDQRFSGIYESPRKLLIKSATPGYRETKNPLQLMPKRVNEFFLNPLLAGFIKRPQAETNRRWWKYLTIKY